MQRRLLIGAAAVCAAFGLLVGLAFAVLVVQVLIPTPSPKSTVPGPSGSPVVLDWKDYPAREGIDGEDLLGAPDRAQLETPARALMADLVTALARVSDSRVVSVEPQAGWFKDDNWFKDDGNGYGGQSMLVSLNCCEVETTHVPDRSRWRAVVDALSDVTADAGMGRITADYDSRGRSTDPELAEEYLKQYCNLPGGACWVWSGSLYDGYQWVDLTIQDGTLDPTGTAARDARTEKQPVAFISIDYGATVVQTGRKRAYERALAPFRGLTRPAATSSD